jgi:hypothetical protein
MVWAIRWQFAAAAVFAALARASSPSARLALSVKAMFPKACSRHAKAEPHSETVVSSATKPAAVSTSSTSCRGPVALETNEARVSN